MARAWLTNGRSIARKVRNATQNSSHQIKYCGVNRECPNCHFLIDNTDVSPEWPGLPAGVKFDPSDEEILHHLEAKCGTGNLQPHTLIDEFIPTLETDQGICYTHPENLPGVRKDGSSFHFFHKTSNAYATGQRKRRKVQNSEHSSSSSAEHVRWHKTGKTKPVIENGIPKGWKKIFSLHKSSKKGSKTHKADWVIHQYHLGTEKDEKEGEYVVSKISYQLPNRSDKNDDRFVIEHSDNGIHQTSPKTPKTNPPVPPRRGKSVTLIDVAEEAVHHSFAREQEFAPDICHTAEPSIPLENDVGCPAWSAGESQAITDCDLVWLDDNLICKEVFDSFALSNEPGLEQISFSGFGCDTNKETRNGYTSSEIADLGNLELDTPPDFHFPDLTFGSQDSIFDWLDRL